MANPLPPTPPVPPLGEDSDEELELRTIATEDIDELSDIEWQESLRNRKKERANQRAEQELLEASSTDTTDLLETTKKSSSDRDEEKEKMVLPAFATMLEDEKETIVVNLGKIKPQARLKVHLVMNMYAERARHFALITSPIDLVADMLEKPKNEIAFVVTPVEIARWNWREELPKAERLNTDHSRLMQGLYMAIGRHQADIAVKLNAQIPNLKKWKYYKELWAEGRQLYSDYQYLMPRCTHEEIEAAIKEELGESQTKIQTKAEIDLHIETKLQEFRQEKEKEERAKVILDASPADGGIRTDATTTDGETITTVAAAPTTLIPPTPAPTASPPKKDDKPNLGSVSDDQGRRTSSRLKPPITPKPSTADPRPGVSTTVDDPNETTRVKFHDRRLPTSGKSRAEGSKSPATNTTVNGQALGVAPRAATTAIAIVTTMISLG